MPFYGCIVVIKRTGADGSTYPLMNKECLLGRAEGCDIRIQLPIVSKEHARISVTVEDGKAFLTALSKTNPTKLNGHSVDNGVRNPLLHKDQFTIGDRHFRWEFPEGSLHCETQSNIEAPVVNHNVSINESSTEIDLQGSTSPLDQEQVPVTKRLAELEAESTPVSKRKRVSFGPAVTPEYIDKNLPPDTPVRKGSLPSLNSTESVCESPRPDSLARSLAIRRSVSKRVSIQPAQAGIAEESSPRGVLKRTESPPGLVKKSSGSRASPRVSTSLSAGYEELSKTETNDTPTLESTSTENIVLDESDKIDTPAKKVDTPAKKVDTPVKKVDTPEIKSLEETPILRGETKSARRSSSGNKAETPAKKEETPAKKAETPAKKAETPAKKADTPAKKAGTPAKKADTPTKKAETPAQKAETPAKKVETPAKKVETPAKKVETPAKKAETLAINVDIPAENKIITPKKAGRPAKSPIKDTAVETPNTETKNKRRSKSVGNSFESINLATDETIVVDSNDNSPKDKTNLEKKDSKAFYGPNPAKTPKGANNVPKTPAPSSKTPKKAGRPSKSPIKHIIETPSTGSETKHKRRSKSEGKISAKKSASSFEKSVNDAIDDYSPVIPNDISSKEKKNIEKKDSQAFYGPNPAKTPKGANNVPKTPGLKKTPPTKKGIKRKSSISPPNNKSKKLKVEKMKKVDETPLAVQISKESKTFYGSNPAKTPKGAKNLPKTPAKTPKGAKNLPKTPKVSKTPKVKALTLKTSRSAIKISTKTPLQKKPTLWSEVVKRNLPKTPKVSKTKTPKGKALTLKTPRSAIKISTKTPLQKKPTLWSEIVKRNAVKAEKAAVNTKPTIVKKNLKRLKQPLGKLHTPKKPKSTVSSFGSPETFIISKRQTVAQPAVKTPKKSTSMKTPTTPKSTTPKAATPKAVTPKAATPKAVTPKAATLKAVTPKAATPKAETPKAATPKAMTPKAATLKAVTPKAASPKAATPKAATPKAMTPKTATPKAVTLKAATPKVATPKVKTPKAATPKVKTPKAATPKAVTPKAATPKAIIPKAITYKAEIPVAATPIIETTTPKAEPLKAATPKVATPKTKIPKAVTPKAITPKAATPKAMTLMAAALEAETPKATPKVDTSKSMTPMTVTPKDATPKAKSTNTPKVKTPKAATPKAVISKSQDMEILQTPPKGLAIKTPKDSVLSSRVSKTPKSTSSKLKAKTPRTIGKKTPKVLKSVKKSTLWSEVVRKNLGKTPNKKVSRGQVAVFKTKKPIIKPARKLHTPKKPKSSVSSIGSFESPETYFITSSKTTAKPVVETKKGRKSIVKNDKMIVKDNTNYEGMTDVFGTPGIKNDVPENDIPEVAISSVSTKKKSSEKRFPKNLSHVGTHKRLSMGSPVITPKNKLIARLKTPNSARSRKSIHAFHSSPGVGERLSQSSSNSPGNLNETDFDFDSVVTPNLSVDLLVSPMEDSALKPRRNRSISNTNVEGVRQLLKTPGPPPKSPANNLSDLKGVKQLMKTPGPPPKSPANDLTDVNGVKKLLKTPGRPPKSPANNLSDVKGVKKLMKTPGRPPKSPSNDLSDLKGVKQLMKTPYAASKDPSNDLSNVGGVKKLLATPKVQKGPANDLTQVGGVKQMFSTSKQQKEPKNDLTNVFGVKKILAIPKTQKDGLNELSDVGGVKQIFSSPKQQYSPKNELTSVQGVKQLMTTPKAPQNSPVADYSHVVGIRKLLRTPGIPSKSPTNEMSDFQGVADLIRTPVAILEQQTSEEPSTSSGGRKKNKRTAADVFVDSEPVKKSAKTSEEEESVPTTSSVTRPVSSRGARGGQTSPSKTSRGNKGSPGMEIPKFNIEDALEEKEDSPVATVEEITTAVTEEPVDDIIKPEDSEIVRSTRKAKPVRRGRGRRGAEIIDVGETVRKTEVLDAEVIPEPIVEEPKITTSNRRQRGVEEENVSVSNEKPKDVESVTVVPKKVGRRVVKKGPIIEELPKESLHEENSISMVVSKDVEIETPAAKEGIQRTTKKDKVTEDPIVDLSQEEPVLEKEVQAPIIKKGGRRGKKDIQSVEIIKDDISAVESTASSEEQSNASSTTKLDNVTEYPLVESSQEELVVEEEVEMPITKKGGRRGKKDIQSVEIMKEDTLVVETAVSSEEQVSTSSRSRRGTTLENTTKDSVSSSTSRSKRGSKQTEPELAVEITEEEAPIVPEPELAVEITEEVAPIVPDPELVVEIAEEKAPIVPEPAKPVRGRGGKAKKSEEKNVSLDVVSVDNSAEIIAPVEIENTEVVATLKTTGRRVVKKTDLDEVKDQLKTEESDETSLPKINRGRRGAKKVEETVPKVVEEVLTKPTRGRRGTKVVSDEIEKKLEIAPILSTEAFEAEKAVIQVVEEIVTKPSRGRRGAKVVSDEIEKQLDTEPISSNNVEEKLEMDSKVVKEVISKPTRGRRGAKAVSDVIEKPLVIEPISSSQVGEVNNAQVGEVNKAEESVPEVIEEVLIKPTRGRRGGKVMPNVIEKPLEIEPISLNEGVEETVIEVIQEVVTKPTRGRRGAKVVPDKIKKPLEIEPISSNEVDENPAPKPAPKGRKRAKASDVELSNEPITSDVSESDPTPPAKRGRRGAAKAVEDVLITTTTPVKKVETESDNLATDSKSTSTSKAVTFAEEEMGATASYKGRGKRQAAKIDASPVLTKPVRGGRAASKAASSKISNDLADMANLNKKKRRPASADREDESSIEESVPVKRGARKVEESVVEEVKPKRATRGRK